MKDYSDLSKEIDHVHNLIKTHKNNLFALEEKKAKLGINVQPETINAIDDEQEQISDLEKKLMALIVQKEHKGSQIEPKGESSLAAIRKIINQISSYIENNQRQDGVWLRSDIFPTARTLLYLLVSGSDINLSVYMRSINWINEHLVNTSEKPDAVAMGILALIEAHKKFDIKLQINDSIECLLKSQLPDGSWEGRYTVNRYFGYSTAYCFQALRAFRQIISSNLKNAQHNEIIKSDVFVSYAWEPESDSIVDVLEQTFAKRGICIIRDKKDLGYKGSIHEFEQRIGRGQCIILVISDKYLRSEHCMYELLEIERNVQLRKRIFPIILESANIFKAVGRLAYINFWQEQIEQLNKAIKQSGVVANMDSIINDLNQYTGIRASFDRLSDLLHDMNALTPDLHSASGFSILINAVIEALSERHMALNSDGGVVQPNQRENYSDQLLNSIDDACHDAEQYLKRYFRSIDFRRFTYNEITNVTDALMLPHYEAWGLIDSIPEIKSATKILKNKLLEFKDSGNIKGVAGILNLLLTEWENLDEETNQESLDWLDHVRNPDLGWTEHVGEQSEPHHSAIVGLTIRQLERIGDHYIPLVDINDYWSLPSSAKNYNKEYSVSGVIYRKLPKKYEIILLQRTDGNWVLPKGHIEVGETPREALVREIKEETGLSEVIILECLGKKNYLFRINTDEINKNVEYYLVRSVARNIIPTPDEVHTSAKWFAVNDIYQISLYYDDSRQIIGKAMQLLEKENI
jgi:8-oxo-dGTP pyrophosphatase MutT (NUDIX family)